MGSAVQVQGEFDQTDVPLVLRASVILGVFTAVVVVLMSFITRNLEGTAEFAVGGAVTLAATFALALLPGLWTKARTIEGIAGAAGIGLGASLVFLVIDVAALQPMHIWTNRWLQIGGGSNWWYHPVWWMVGSFIPWMGAYGIANMAARGGVSIPKFIVLTLVGTAISTGVAIAMHIPHAGVKLGTVGVALLPGLAIAALLTGLGQKQS